jgi:hypothetical protein
MAQKIREQLGGSLSLLDAFPPKPKGMHRRVREASETARCGYTTDDGRIPAYVAAGHASPVMSAGPQAIF